jgi:hypothetical protein
VDPITIPYNPGYFDAVRASVMYLWKCHRRALFWFVVLLAVDAFVITNGVKSWTLWVTTSAAALTAAVGFVPLAFRILWAYKIRQLGIHELEVADGRIELRGTGLRVQSPLELYDGVIETTPYFLLTRPNGLFSFIPKQSISADAIDRLRGVLRAGISRRHARVPGASEVST